VQDSEKDKVEEFWKVNSYVAGLYDKQADFKNLDTHLTTLSANASRLFYLALPPSVYDTVTSITNFHVISAVYEYVNFYSSKLANKGTYVALSLAICDRVNISLKVLILCLQNHIYIVTFFLLNHSLFC